MAILLSPGFALPSQERTDDVINDWKHYLEGDNASPEDAHYQHATNALVVNTDSFNDRLLTLSRSELMAAVERRVLKQVVLVLHTYANRYGSDEDGDGSGDTYLWLAPFDDPSTASYSGEVGQSYGQIALHWSEQNVLATDFTLNLRLASDAEASASGSVSIADLTTASIAFVVSEGSSCLWHDANSVGCQASTSARMESAAVPPPATWRQRYWRLKIAFSGSPTYVVASASDVRRRSVSTTNLSGVTLS